MHTCKKWFTKIFSIRMTGPTSSSNARLSGIYVEKGASELLQSFFKASSELLPSFFRASPESTLQSLFRTSSESLFRTSSELTSSELLQNFFRTNEELEIVYISFFLLLVCCDISFLLFSCFLLNHCNQLLLDPIIM